eukprot:c24594_g1_i1 orf=708-2672(-)
MAAMVLKRLGRRCNIVNGLLHRRMTGADSNPKHHSECILRLSRQFSVLALQRRACRVSHVVPFGLHFAIPVRGLQEQALALSGASERHVYEDADSQAAASALQSYLQKHSKAYLSDAAAVVDCAPLFVRQLVDHVKQKRQETTQVIQGEPGSEISTKEKKNTPEPAQSADAGFNFEKQVQVYLSTESVNVLEPIFESVGMVSDRCQALLQKLSVENVDVQSLLFVIRWIQKLGFSRSTVGDIIEKDVGVLSYKSGEVEAGFSTLKELSIPQEEILSLIVRYPLVLKAEVVNNIAALGVELRALPSKDVIIRKAVCDNPNCVQMYAKGCADSVLHFLRSYGLTDERLNHLLQRHFRLVFTDVEKKFKCNVKFLKDLGVSRHTIGKVINRCPNFLFYSLEDNLMVRLEYFKSLGLSEGEFALIVSRYPNIFSASLENKIKPVVEELRTVGLTDEGLKKVMIYRPSLFAYKQGGYMSTLISGLRESSYSENQKVTAFIKLFTRGMDHRKKCEDCLTQYGLSASEAKQVLDKEPGILGYNEKALALRIEHLTKTLGIPIQNVVSAPEYLCFGFRRRILRRQRVLAYMKSAGLLTDAFTLKQLVSPSNTQFYDTFVKPHSEDQELSKIWLKEREGMGKADGLNFIQNYTGSTSGSQVNL